MSDFDPEQFEAELQTLRPAKPTQTSLNRILNELPLQVGRPALPPSRNLHWSWIGLLRLIIPAGAVIVLLSIWVVERRSTLQPQHQVSSSYPLVTADKIEIDRQLVADFDAVGKLRTGEPVRFRCQQWMEKIWLRDTAKGVVIERTTPHLEIVPVRFETD